MKKYIVSLLSVLSLAACSNIDEDERLVLVEDREIKGEVAVLVEDFTGQKCTNCPNATRLLTSIRETYGAEKVIPVAIHSGGYAFWGTPSALGLANDLGEYYWNKNGFNSLTPQPTAVFNRHTTSAETDQWTGIIYNEISSKAMISIEGSCSYDAATRTVTIKIEHKSNESVNANLQLWLTESDIVAMQVDNGITDRNYVHNHVLRDAINGNDGEPCSLGIEKQTVIRTYTIPEDYVAENCDVVAFFYNNNGVLNVIDIPVNR